MRTVTQRLFSSGRRLLQKTGPETSPPLARVVYMSQLPYDVTKEQLSQAFERYGPIEELHLQMAADREHTKGHGRMVFADERNARRAAVQMQSYVLNNMPIKLTLGSEQRRRQATRYDVVMLRNLPHDALEDELMKVLRPYQALRVGLPRSPVTQEGLGYGYVRFGSAEAAERAVRELKGTSVGGRRLRLHVAEPKKHHYRFIV